MKDIIDRYLVPFKKYAVFTGRATRKEYWAFFLINSLISFILLSLGNHVLPGFHTLRYVFAFALLIPMIAVSVRRLHDIGRSGWNLLWFLLPLLGALLLLIYYISPSQKGKNKYDEDYVAPVTSENPSTVPSETTSLPEKTS